MSHNFRGSRSIELSASAEPLPILQAEPPESNQYLTCHFEQMRELYIAKGRDIMRNVPGEGILSWLIYTLPMGSNSTRWNLIKDIHNNY